MLQITEFEASSRKENGEFLEHVLWGIWLFWDWRKALQLWFQVSKRSFHMYQPFADHLHWCVAADHDHNYHDPEVLTETTSGSNPSAKLLKIAASVCHSQWLSGVGTFVLRHLVLGRESEENPNCFASWLVDARVHSGVDMVVSRLNSEFSAETTSKSMVTADFCPHVLDFWNSMCFILVLCN